VDFAIVNAENSAGGFGLTSAIAEEFFNAGADCLTLGDHAWDQREALTYIEREPRLLRPLNYPPRPMRRGRGRISSPCRMAAASA
jgi:calcineurin-like phosphoesterase